MPICHESGDLTSSQASLVNKFDATSACRSDYRFVEGEVKVARGSWAFSTLQTDSEFAIDAKWQDLGGSDQAASYLDMDQAGDAFVAKCSREEEEDCVYDVCHGAGETAAELAAELLESTRAIQGI